MTIVLLASVSLFALVVTSRPVLPSDANLRDFVARSSTLQTSVQAPFQLNAGKNDLTSDAVRFHFQRPKQQIEYLPELDKEDDEAIASFQILPEEPLAFEALADKTPHALDTLDAHAHAHAHDNTRADDVTDDLAASQPVAVERHEPPTDESPSAPLVVLTFSCVAALLALACVALSLYIVKFSLRPRVLASKTAWDLLPRFWRRRIFQENTGAAPKQHLSGGGCLLLHAEVGPRGLLGVEQGAVQRSELHPNDKPVYFDVVSDIESEQDDVDEKYQDALDMMPLPLLHDPPLEHNVSHPSHFDDTPLPPMGSYPPDPPVSDRSTLLVRELCLSPSPVSRPAWSVRALDSSTLGSPSRHFDATPQPLIHPRRRAYRAPVPEFDIALAMQLRPGLGIGADSAWMVRFLMAIFGWFAVALTGNAR